MINRQRRDLLAAAACTAGLALAPTVVRAQGAPQLNNDSRLVEPTQPSDAGGKIEVIEFFGYWCPHCAEFEPLMTSWSKRVPGDVQLRYVPVAFSPAQDIYSKFFYALDAMGLVASMHGKVFNALHTAKTTTLATPEMCADFMASNGVDRAKFLDTLKSFGVQSRAQQAKRVCDAYRVEGTPALAVAGRFYTAPSMAADGGPGALRVVDYLLDQVRRAPAKA
ncbi:thiol:disulfide interchange protein DsbA/DsbL [soil metagenome]